METVEVDGVAVLWRRLDGPGLEQCGVVVNREVIAIDGAVVTQDDGGVAWRIEYAIECDSAWNTRRVSVQAHAGTKTHRLTLRVDGAGRWTVNDLERPDLQGCTDVDLGFSPSTNTLPIRRLNLGIAQSATIEAAWVEFPSLAVKRVAQRYTRTAERRYRYDNLPTGFQAEIAVDDRALVVSYPPGWERDGSARPLDDSLLSGAPSPELADAPDLYSGLIGSWNVEVTDHDADGTRRTTEGEWHFSWALEGRAVQDVFIVPKRSARGGSSARTTGNRYGTTIRFFDAASGQWLITWINPVTGAVNRLAAHREGNAIVQIGTDPDGTMRRWTFVDVTQNRFRWIGEESSDRGATWHISAEFIARRR